MCLARMRLQMLAQGVEHPAVAGAGGKVPQQAVERAGRAGRAGATFERGVR
jgi:hypothetical protein